VVDLAGAVVDGLEVDLRLAGHVDILALKEMLKCPRERRQRAEFS
jgi:hypothetical protein